MHIKVDQNKTKADLNSLAICKEIAKIDADKLTQREVGSRLETSWDLSYIISQSITQANNLLKHYY